MKFLFQGLAGRLVEADGGANVDLETAFGSINQPRKVSGDQTGISNLVLVEPESAADF